MISPEILRRYPFFSHFNATQLKRLAMLAEEIQVPTGETLFKRGEPANAMYLLLEGNVELYDEAQDQFDSNIKLSFYVGNVEAGEVLGMSAAIPPYRLTATAKTSTPCRLIRFDAKRLREEMRAECAFAAALLVPIGQVALERLSTCRTLLAAEMHAPHERGT
ncbi:MAG: cyclic nucleotide-binding domain-containing protein [Anaerolineae bacterium]|nr:MAG: cyclic nucleotide-binding domain-containing protein [Anaerolineae bacterium]